MTVVELFDRSPLQNLSGALTSDADRVVFVALTADGLKSTLPSIGMWLQDSVRVLRSKLCLCINTICPPLQRCSAALPKRISR